MEPSSSASEPPAQPKSAPGRVSSACQRCRQRKLKCDSYRPCTLCVRAGATCSSEGKSATWKAYQPSETLKRARKDEESSIVPQSKRVASPGDEGSVALSFETDNPAIAPDNRIEDRSPPSEAVASPWTSNSAAMQFMEEAFHQHDSATPKGSEMSALSANQWTRENVAEHGDVSIVGTTQRQPVASRQDATQSKGRQLSAISAAEKELLSLLPCLEPAKVLVDNYFDRIHWFMLVFHQSDFKERFQRYYEGIERPTPELRASIEFLSVFGAVCALSLTYMDAQQDARLSDFGIQPAVLRQQLLTTLRLRLLDVVSRGSIEAVQACVLLGSYYLYHGEPELAWPICGCGLRIAQALMLHRRSTPKNCGPPDIDDPAQRAQETRKRCWWAVYEIETFCSMLYGFPLSINDDDCDVELLDPYPLRSGDFLWHSAHWKETGQATLLSYKYSMVQLSIIVRSALVDLYGLRHNPSDMKPKKSYQHRLHDLIGKVAKLERRLEVWRTSLPKQLQLGTPDEITGASAGANDRYLFSLQHLSLKLAFENAKILIHRPLLSYKMVTTTRTANIQGRLGTANALDPCRSSVRACRDAALQVSEISASPIIKEATNTYAVSFISLHFLTAAVALSILTTLNPLSQESHDCKMGIRRLMEVQSRLSTNSIIARQGLPVLKKLVALVLSKEAEHMLEMPSETRNAASGVEASQDTQMIHSMPEESRPQEGNGVSETQFVENDSANNTLAEQGLLSTMNTDIPAHQPTMDLCEDPMVFEALQDFELAINHVPGELGSDGALPFDNLGEGSESCFSNPDYGRSWIWSANHYVPM